MSDIVIKVENLYKEYRLGTISHGTLYRDLQSWWARMRGKEDPNSIISSSQPFTSHASQFTTHDSRLTASDNPHFLALQDVSFEVKRGEVLGIIGRNGAGKSTLLKILSEVTAPTSGSVKIKGRVASLLEVGTGFHPELTGRENIYLNGAILGMTKKEIDCKFDEIVAFAELDKFIDTPVKRYSSGMYVRLAFAVAAHLEPEILIVDEVLAVGDASFQKKCLGKMGEVAKEGRTVLFVSHNMAAIETLCSRIILIEKGEMVFAGDVKTGIDQYLSSGPVSSGYVNLESHTENRWGPQIFSKINSIETMDENGQRTGFIKMGRKYYAKVEFEISRLAEDIELVIYFTNYREISYGIYSSRIEGYTDFRVGRQGVTVEIPEMNLMPGDYSVGVWINSNKQSQDDIISKALKIEVTQDINLTGHPADYIRYKDYGVLNRSYWKSV